jgi:hypothetical protein
MPIEATPYGTKGVQPTGPKPIANERPAATKLGVENGGCQRRQQERTLNAVDAVVGNLNAER